MLTNDIKKGARFQLRNGWFATMEDNRKGATRLATRAEALRHDDDEDVAVFACFVHSDGTLEVPGIRTWSPDELTRIRA